MGTQFVYAVRECLMCVPAINTDYAAAAMPLSLVFGEGDAVGKSCDSSSSRAHTHTHTHKLPKPVLSPPPALLPSPSPSTSSNTLHTCNTHIVKSVYLKFVHTQGRGVVGAWAQREMRCCVCGTRTYDTDYAAAAVQPLFASARRVAAGNARLAILTPLPQPRKPSFGRYVVVCLCVLVRVFLPYCPVVCVR
jgi:hypothetical protein